jgi:predicted lipoprotein
MRRDLISFLWVTLIAVSLWACPAHAEADHGAIAKAALTQVIRPGYDALEKAAAALEGKVKDLCGTPSEKALQDAKTAFAAVVAAWSQVQILRFGPVTQDHRFERLLYWPDPKGLGQKQVLQALDKQDQSVTVADTLADKSVALQGLPALEFLLYGDGSEALGNAGGEPDLKEGDTLDEGQTNTAFRCSFASSIATNIQRIAQDVAEGWRDGSDFAKAFLSPTPDSSLYHTPKEVTLELFKAFTAGIELVRDQKLAKPLGASAEEAKPRLAAFWRSGLAFRNMAGNVEGAHDLFAKGGFQQVVAQESPGVEGSILFDLNHAIDVLGSIDGPVAEVFAEPALRAKLQALRVALKSARDTAGDIVSRGAGLSFGFNAMDGD